VAAVRLKNIWLQNKLYRRRNYTNDHISVRVWQMG